MKKKNILIVLFIMVEIVAALPNSKNSEEQTPPYLPSEATQYEYNTRISTPNNYIVANQSVATNISIIQLCRSQSPADKATDWTHDMILWNATNTFRNSTPSGQTFCDGLTSGLSESYSYAAGTNYIGSTHGHESAHILIDASATSSYYVDYSFDNSADQMVSVEFMFNFMSVTAPSTSTFAEFQLARTGSSPVLLGLRLVSGTYYLTCWYASAFHDIVAVSSSTWYHVQISQYNTYQFYIFVNGVYKGTVNTNAGSALYPNYMRVTSTAGYQVTLITDAIDCSQCIGYYVNRDLYRNMTASFYNLYPGEYQYQVIGSMESGDNYYAPVQTLTISINETFDNTQLISESLHTTNWEIKDVTLSDNITNTLAINVSNYYTERYAAIEDTSVWSLYPTFTFNTGDRIFIQNKTVVDEFGGERIGFVDFAAISPNDHYIGTNLSLFYGSSTDPVSVYYSSVDRDFSGLTWNTKGTTDTNTVIGTLPIASNGWHTVTLTDYQPYLVFRNTVQRAGDFSGAALSAYTIESTYYPEAELTLGYIKYNSSLNGINLRTNTTENIGLSKSVAINRNDIIQITLNNSEAIECNLKINGSIVKTLKSIGYNTQNWVANVDYGTTTIELTYAMTATAIADVRAVEIYSATDSLLNITIAPQNDKDVYVTPGLHGVLIFEEGTLVQFSIIQFNASENIIIYSTSDLMTVQISLFDASYNGLTFIDYIISVQYVKYNFTVSETLLNNIIYVDQGSSINITIRDKRFSTLIYQNKLVATEFLNIVCNVYSLRIRNNMNKISQITLNSTYANTILVGEQIALSLPRDNYTLTYSNDAAIPTTQSLTINLNKNWPIQLNTTRFSVYFAVFDQQGLGVEYNSLRFYIDNVRRDFGINQVNNPSLITVLDYFNATIYNSTINTNNVTEFNIYAPIYTIILEHNFTQAMYCKISRSDLTFAPFEVAIEPNHPMPYKFLANMHYSVKWYYGNGTLAKSESILLSDNKKLTFGAHTYETPQLTKSDLQSQIFDWIYLVILMAIVTLVGIYVGSLSKNQNYPKKNDPIINQIDQRTIHRKSKTWGVRK